MKPRRRLTAEEIEYIMEAYSMNIELEKLRKYGGFIDSELIDICN